MNQNSNDISRKERDESLGRVVSCAVATAERVSDCPDDGALAALLDQALPEAERDRLMTHLASCDRCLEAYTLAARLQRSASSSRKGWAGGAAAIAAVAVVVVAVIVTRYEAPVQTAKAPPVAPGQTASATQPIPGASSSKSGLKPSLPLSNSSSRAPITFDPAVVALAKSILEREGGGGNTGEAGARYAFVGTTDPGRIAFRSGVTLIDLASAVSSGGEGQRISLERLAGLLGKDADAIGVTRALGEDAPLSEERFTEVVQRVEHQAEISGQLATLRFGAWVEAGRLSSRDKFTTLVNPVAVRYFLDNLDPESISDPVRQALERLGRQVGGARPLADKEFRNVRRVLDEVRDLY